MEDALGKLTVSLNWLCTAFSLPSGLNAGAADKAACIAAVLHGHGQSRAGYRAEGSEPSSELHKSAQVPVNFCHLLIPLMHELHLEREAPFNVYVEDLTGNYILPIYSS